MQKIGGCLILVHLYQKHGFCTILEKILYVHNLVYLYTLTIPHVNTNQLIHLYIIYY